MFNTSQINHLTIILYFQKAATNSNKSPSSKGCFLSQSLYIILGMVMRIEYSFFIFFTFSASGQKSQPAGSKRKIELVDFF